MPVFVEIQKRPMWLLRNLRIVSPVALHICVYGTLEQWQRPEPFDPAQSRFNGQQRAGYPPVLLVGRAPVIHLVRHLPQLGVQRFQTVGGLETDAEGGEHAQSMESERLLKPFL